MLSCVLSVLCCVCLLCHVCVECFVVCVECCVLRVLCSAFGFVLRVACVVLGRCWVLVVGRKVLFVVLCAM